MNLTAMIHDILNGTDLQNHHHNNNPIIMALLFVLFAINFSVSIAAATDIIRLCAAVGAAIPAIGAAILWVKNNKDKFTK
jgi:hypothetical protein